MVKSVVHSDKLVNRLSHFDSVLTGDLGYMCGLPDLTVASICGSLNMGQLSSTEHGLCTV